MSDNLRPTSFASFVGQSATIRILKDSSLAARQRGDALDHVLLSGPPGLGKTSLAMIVAHDMRADLKIISAPMIRHKSELVAVLRGLRKNDCVFVDEVHALKPIFAESVFSALEDFRLDFCFGSNVRSIRLQPFTMIAATTRPGALLEPLRARFGIHLQLTHYNVADLSAIVLRSAKLLGVAVDAHAAAEIARRSRGTPRTANSLLRRVRDAAQLRGEGITLQLVQDVGNALGIDAAGLDAMDRKLLHACATAQRPVGLDALSASLSEDAGTVESREPFLLQSKLLARTARGRVATPAAFRLLGIPQFARIF